MARWVGARQPARHASKASGAGALTRRGAARAVAGAHISGAPFALESARRAVVAMNAVAAPSAGPPRVAGAVHALTEALAVLSPLIIVGAVRALQRWSALAIDAAIVIGRALRHCAAQALAIQWVARAAGGAAADEPTVDWAPHSAPLAAVRPIAHVAASAAPIPFLIRLVAGAGSCRRACRDAAAVARADETFSAPFGARNCACRAAIDPIAGAHTIGAAYAAVVAWPRRAAGALIGAPLAIVTFAAHIAGWRGIRSVACACGVALGAVEAHAVPRASAGALAAAVRQAEIRAANAGAGDAADAVAVADLPLWRRRARRRAVAHSEVAQLAVRAAPP